ncbi:MAG: hypothetical protein AAF231_07820 [Pseudomonadota bacterium]
MKPSAPFLLTFQIAALLLGALGVYGLALFHIRTGFDLSDSSLYLLLVTQPENIGFSLSHFGVVWNALIGDHGVIANRVINIALLCAAALLLTFTYWFTSQGRIARMDLFVFSILAFLGCSGAIAVFILDPSYNSLTQIFVITGICSVALVADLQRRHRFWRADALSFVAGFCVAALVVTKASTAVMLGLYLLIAAVLLAYKARSPRVVMTGLLGVVAFPGVLELTTGLTGHVIDSFTEALQAHATASSNISSQVGLGGIQRILSLITGVDALFPAGWYVVLFAVFFLPWRAILRKDHARQGTSWPVILPVALFTLGTVALAIAPSGKGALINIMTIAFLIGYLLVAMFWRPKTVNLPQNLFVTGMLLAPFLTVFGTVNDYKTNIFLFGAAFSLLPAWLVLSHATSPGRNRARHLLLSCGLLAAVVSAVNAYHYPYRLTGTLAQARVPVDFPDGSTLRATPAVADLLSGLQANAAGTTSPAVFDLTGELPIAAYALQGRVPKVAWLLSNFSQEFSLAVFSSLPPEDITTGWILLPLNEKKVIEPTRHAVSFFKILDDMGIAFDTHFYPAATLRTPILWQEGEDLDFVLFKPVSQR